MLVIKKMQDFFIIIYCIIGVVNNGHENADKISKKARYITNKDYKQYFEKSRKQTQYLKDNWSFDKMTETLNRLLPKIEATSKMQTLNLPKLKKKTTKTELPKLKLPKLKKIEA